jgi:hypothetical protein
MPSSDREDKEDNRFYPTIFILWGEEPICMMLLVRQREAESGRLTCGPPHREGTPR